MFAFACGSKSDEDDSSDKENSSPIPPSSPHPWLKKRKLTPLCSPVDSDNEFPEAQHHDQLSS